MQSQDLTGEYREANKASAGLVLWTIAWVATLALAKFGPEYVWDQSMLSWAAVSLNLAVGIGWILAHARFLRRVDELQRRIMQDALAITLGVGWVGGFAYVVADAAGLIASEPDIAMFPTLLGVVYMLAIVGGHLRYR